MGVCRTCGQDSGVGEGVGVEPLSPEGKMLNLGGKLSLGS